MRDRTRCKYIVNVRMQDQGTLLLLLACRRRTEE